MKQLSDYILVIENVIPNDLMAAINREYINSSDWVLATTKGGLDQQTRNCSTIGLSFSSIIQKNPVLRTHIDSEIHTATQKILAKYKGKFPDIIISSDTGYDLLRYEVEQFYTQHTDSFTEMTRALS